MAIVHAVIALALVEFVVFGILVGRARAKYHIEAPAITGNPMFERYFRVHYNTMEQLVCFVPGMLLFAIYINARAAAVLGVIVIIGRIIYLRGYLADPKKRGPGFGLSMIATVILLLGGFGGAVWSAMH